MDEIPKAQLDAIRRLNDADLVKLIKEVSEYGWVIQPASGLRLARDVSAASNGYEAFVQDCCVIALDRTVRPIILFNKFEVWCRENGRADLLMTVKLPQHLGGELRKNVAGLENLRSVRPDNEDGSSGPRLYVGIGLKTKADQEKEDDLAEAPKPKPVPPIVIKFKRRI